ncbi:hypothetical protein GGF32_009558 [Allomyces javanicus]|nr:hypothetical protein GGF32_009558 [Allomyces javanicus]
MPYKATPWTAESIVPLHVICPKCALALDPDADAYLRYRFNGQLLKCDTCATVFSVNEASARRFLDELKSAVAKGVPFTGLPGVHTNPKTRVWAADFCGTDLEQLLSDDGWKKLLENDDKRSDENDGKPMLTWETIATDAVRPSFRGIKTKLSNNNLYRSLLASYRDIATGPWSMDLVQAVLRQREFTRKMAVTEYSDHTRRIATQATVRYHKLMLMLAQHRDLFMVPTLDIDLAWHTHQLHPQRYAAYTLDKLGAVLNHDDTIESPRLKEGFTKTAHVWSEMFGEPYACDAAFRSYWTPGKVSAATIVAPVALPLLMRRASKHKSAVNKQGGCVALPAAAVTPRYLRQAFAFRPRRGSNVAPTSTKAGSSRSANSATGHDDSRLDPRVMPAYFYSGCAVVQSYFSGAACAGIGAPNLELTNTTTSAPPVVAAAAAGDSAVTSDAGPAVLSTQAEATPVVVDSCVTQARCEAHLRILGAFQILQAQDDEIADLTFLCRGEVRYEAWMRALAREIQNDPRLITEPPIPPVDVAMFWFAHMLSPIRYNDDMNRLFGAQILDVAFPLERMALQIHQGTWCKASHDFWYFKVSRTMAYDATPWTVESLVPLHVHCPKCTLALEPDADAFLRYRFNGQQLTCGACSTVFSVNEVSTHRFLDEIKAALATGLPYTALPGVHIDPTTRVWSDVNGVSELELLLDDSSWITLFAPEIEDRLPVWETVATAALRPSFRAVQTKLSNTNLYRSLIAAYRDIATGPWSMDLVQAVLRQREFTRKMSATEYSDRTRRIATQATVRYHKLMLMLAKNRGMFMVPTLDIDLAWHTHQLHPRRYAAYTYEKLGAVLNHDDTIESPRLKQGFTKTAHVWRSMFNEPYACDAAFRSYWTPAKVAVATVAAPVMLPLLMRRASKHKAAVNKQGGCVALPGTAVPPQQMRRAFAIRPRSAVTAPGTSKKDKKRESNAATDHDDSRAYPPTMPIFFYSACAMTTTYFAAAAPFLVNI